MAKYIDFYLIGDLVSHGSVFYEDLKNIPEEDVRPNDYGEWMTETTEDGEFWANYCSECKSYLPYGLEWKPDYCPMCGREMRGKKHAV